MWKFQWHWINYNFDFYTYLRAIASGKYEFFTPLVFQEFFSLVAAYIFFVRNYWAEIVFAA